MYAIANPHVAVTHVSFACSGAQMVKTTSEAKDGGLLDPYEGIEPCEGPSEATPQVAKAARQLALAGRIADYITLSIGGNDMGFGSDVLSALRKDAESGASFEAGVKSHAAAGLQRLENALPHLQQEMSKPSFAGAPIFLVAYPDPLEVDMYSKVNGDHEDCGAEVGVGFLPADIFGMKISPEEAKILKRELLGRILPFQKDKLAAALVGCAVVDAHLPAFKQHGYCGLGLNRVASPSRWINTVRDSVTLEGSHTGAMHPNIRGQTAIGEAILLELLKRECDGGKLDEEMQGHLCKTTIKREPAKDWIRRYLVGVHVGGM